MSISYWGFAGYLYKKTKTVILVCMSAARTSRGTSREQAVEAAYYAFAKNGLERTGMQDIARELGKTRPVVYRFFTDKNDAFRQVTKHLLDRTLAVAQAAARGQGTPDERIFGVLDAKLTLAVRIHEASPHFGRALLAEDTGLVADLARDYMAALGALLVEILKTEMPLMPSRELSIILLALTRGLEDDLSDPAGTRAQLRLAISLLARP